MTQRELAAELNVELMIVGRWETGDRKPHPLMVVGIRSVLNRLEGERAERGNG